MGNTIKLNKQKIIMNPTTFKFYAPDGACRRFTFEAVPELAAVNELVDTLVESPVENRRLFYLDSDNDRVVIKTSRDLVEAVRDVQSTGASSVKIHIRVQPQVQHQRKTKTTTNGSRPCRSWGWQYHYPRSGLFVHPGTTWKLGHQWDDIGADVLKDLNDIFPDFFRRCDISNDERSTSPGAEAEKRAEDPTPVNSEKKQEDAPTAPSTSTTDATAEESDESRAQVTSGNQPPGSSESEPVTAAHEKEAGISEDELTSKATLLKEMGFDIPVDVAKNMIVELNGRMDLIVRA